MSASNMSTAIARGMPHVLPIEIWEIITEHLHLLGLTRLATTCKHLHSGLAPRVWARRYRTIYSRGTIRDAPKGSHIIGQVLELMLRDQLPASFVKKISCDECPKDCERSEWREDYDWGHAICSIDNGRVLQRALESSPWIYEHEYASFTKNIADGDEEVALFILLPMLHELRLLCTFCGADRFPDRVARIAKNPSVAHLQKLEPVDAAVKNGEWGIVLGDLATLPSVRTVIARQSYCDSPNGNFKRWPEDLPRSRASKVCFIDACVVKADIEKWAGGFHGPCTMMQNYYQRGGSTGSQRDPDWDIAVVTGQVDPTTGLVLPETRRVDINLSGDFDPDMWDDIDWPVI